MAQGGLAVELEELGMVAMIAALLIPGAAWIAKSKSKSSLVWRSILVGGVLVATVAVEASIDRTAETLTDVVKGEA